MPSSPDWIPLPIGHVTRRAVNVPRESPPQDLGGEREEEHLLY